MEAQCPPGPPWPTHIGQILFLARRILLTQLTIVTKNPTRQRTKFVARSRLTEIRMPPKNRQPDLVPYLCGL